jgi:glycosyltransferase involved in cell wall biosynthesis
VHLLGPLEGGADGPSALDLMVSVHARRPDIEWQVAGRTAADPDAHARLIAEARRLGLVERLRVQPSIVPAEQPAALAACDAAVQLAGDPWDCGLGLKRALACGLPVVAPESPPWDEWVRHGTEGLRVAPGDAVAMTRALTTLLAGDAARGPFAERARLAAFEHHERTRALAAHEDAYRRAVERSLPRAA